MKRKGGNEMDKDQDQKRTMRSLTEPAQEPKLHADEEDAITQTVVGPESDPPCRDLVDFTFYDFDGDSQALEMSKFVDLFISGLVLPLDGAEGIWCEEFGVIHSWAISGYDEGRPVIWVSTDAARYRCRRPETDYKHLFFDPFLEKARICVQVYKLLTRPGDWSLVLDKLIVGAITLFGTSIGPFIFEQVTKMGIGSELAAMPAMVSLKNASKEPEGADEMLAILLQEEEIQIHRHRQQPAASSWSDGDSETFNGDFAFEQPTKMGSGLELAAMPTLGSLKNAGKGPEGADEMLAMSLQEEENRRVGKQSNHQQASSLEEVKNKIEWAEEILEDCPLPYYYIPSVPEADERQVFDDGVDNPDQLRVRVLNNWCLYDSDDWLVSLELIPMMKPGPDTDFTILGSGMMGVDYGSGFCSSAVDSSSESSFAGTHGLPICLSVIREWKIEYEDSMISLSIRTDMAWYKLGKPLEQYAPWHELVMRTVRLARRIINLLLEQSEGWRLSFADVIKHVTEFPKDDPDYISTDVTVVERYLVVHGLIVLRMFEQDSNTMIPNCAFATCLAERMEKRTHTKVEVRGKAKLQQKQSNLNPIAETKLVYRKRKKMPATMTRLIDRVWTDYYSKYLPEDPKEGDDDMPKEEEELEEEVQEENVRENLFIEEEKTLDLFSVASTSKSKLSGNKIRWQDKPTEEELDDEDDVWEENLFIEEEKTLNLRSFASTSKTELSDKEIRWQCKPVGHMASGEAVYKSSIVHGSSITVGKAVMFVDDESQTPTIVLVEFMFERLDGLKMAHGRVLIQGSLTVLGSAANEREIFLTNECIDFGLQDLIDTVAVELRVIKWGHQYRKEQADTDMTDLSKAAEGKNKGPDMEFYCKSLYCPEKGAFLTLPFNTLGLGTGVCDACRIRETKREIFIMNSSTSFVYMNKQYNVGDFVYVRPKHSDEGKQDHQSFKSRRNVGLKAYIVCQLLDVEGSREFKESTTESSIVKLRRFYRPEDISSKRKYSADIREVYYSEEIISVPVEFLEGKCEVTKRRYLPEWDFPVMDHLFFCECSYDATTGAIKRLPASSKFSSQYGKTVDTTSSSNRVKGKCIVGEQDQFHQFALRENRLATLDIFSGCGGLSEGLRQSGVSFTKWAIEYERIAGEAFSLNHPDALVYIDNCNVILRAIMHKCGDEDDCISTPEVGELAAVLDAEKLKELPMPGQVDFIIGGPPSQGFSKMNRFSQSTWSKVRCEMILAFLSFADYFRPRYFLLESVRNFMSFNKGQTFRLTLASLLEMGYQVRFGILEPGAYGVSQSRRRAFIWAASPGETLPEWPEPMHVFADQGLNVPLPLGAQYAAVRSTAGGAPFRPITVRDTIGALPPVTNGASKLTMPYPSGLMSWFHYQIRGFMEFLNDHICKEMNELNLIRCRRIPRDCPGADWHMLPEEKVTLSNGQVVDLIPSCLLNTANSQNQLNGLFGRLDWEGNFPSCTTDPNPMGKVGMWFHPDQNRILTVRECARSQGFRDSYQFYGNIQNMHRQVGNAVPPPLAYALGRKLKEAVNAKYSLT